jgi:phosphohistidine phosphatase
MECEISVNNNLLMKSVLLVRHAKSSWDYDVEDFDRPLNHRGESDAPEMAKRLIERNIKVDAFVSSPAKRALATAAFFAEAYNKKKKSIIVAPALYEPTAESFLETIEGLENDLKTVALFSHNPAITSFVNSLTSVIIDDMPTCSVFGLKADIKKWKEFKAEKKEFWFFDYPKAEQ